MRRDPCVTGRRIGACLIGLALSLAAGRAHAQAELERFSRRLEQIERDRFVRVNEAVPASQRTYFDYGAYLSFDYLFLEDRFQDTHVLRQYDLTGYARLNLDNIHEFYIRGSVGYRDFNDGDSFDGRGDEIVDPDLDGAFYRLDLARAAQARRGTRTDDVFTIQVGRDLAYWANGLVLSVPLDGVVARVGRRWLVGEFLAGVTPVRTIDLDPSRPNFDHHTRRAFLGSMLSGRIAQHRPFAYVLFQRDLNDDDELPPLPGVDPSQDFRVAFEYNSYYVGVGSTGALGDRLLYGVEAAFEGGRAYSNKTITQSGSTVTTEPQTSERIEAWALDARLDFLPGDRRSTRISAEVLLASGDADRRLSTSTIGGNRSRTVDHAFNSLGLINTGLALAPSVSNLAMVRLGASTLPLPEVELLSRLQVGVDLFVFAKMSERGGIDEPTGGGRYLGWEPDFFLNWQVTHDLTFSLRYGIFFPNDENFEDDGARQFFFTGVTYAF